MHFYDVDGNSAHTVLGANGKMRNTTIRDARKLGLVPSVSTVKDVGLGYNLMAWMLNLLLDSAFKLPFNVTYSEKDWKADVMRHYNVNRSKAAERGTEIHDKLDQYFIDGTICEEDARFIKPVIATLEKEFPGVTWISEASFCDKERGYGGRVDLHSVTHNIVLDFKTKDKADIKKVVQYDDHRMQLAAYQVGLGLPSTTRRFNLFVSVSEETPGECHLVECLEFDKFINLYYAYLNLWKVKNKYDPTEFLK